MKYCSLTKRQLQILHKFTTLCINLKDFMIFEQFTEYGQQNRENLSHNQI
jgi:hypothetical protein